MRRCYVMLTVFYQSPNKLFLYSLIMHCCKIERLGKSSYRNLHKIETFWDVQCTYIEDYPDLDHWWKLNTKNSSRIWYKSRYQEHFFEPQHPGLFNNHSLSPSMNYSSNMDFLIHIVNKNSPCSFLFKIILRHPIEGQPLHQAGPHPRFGKSVKRWEKVNRNS